MYTTYPFNKHIGMIVLPFLLRSLVASTQMHGMGWVYVDPTPAESLLLFCERVTVFPLFREHAYVSLQTLSVQLVVTLAVCGRIHQRGRQFFSPRYLPSLHSPKIRLPLSAGIHSETRLTNCSPSLLLFLPLLFFLYYLPIAGGVVLQIGDIIMQRGSGQRTRVCGCCSVDCRVVVRCMVLDTPLSNESVYPYKNRYG